MSKPRPGERLWLDQPDARERAASTAPDPEIARHALELIEHGYTVIRSGLTQAACQEALRSFEEWCTERPADVASRRGANGYLPRLVNLHLVATPVARLFTTAERALAIQDFCFGYRTALYTSLFYERGSAQTSHRDIPYFRTEPIGFYFGMWVALEPIEADNGPLFVIDRGHRIPYVDPHSIGAKRFAAGEPIPSISLELWRDYQNQVASLCAEAGLGTTKLLLDRGDVVLWHPLAPHGGAAIADPHRTRLSIVFHTTPEGVPVYQGDVFFDRSASPAPEPSWSYRELDGRKIADLSGGAHFG